MKNFIIERGGEIKEAFRYDRSLKRQRYTPRGIRSVHYGDDAVLRPITQEEEAEFMRHGSEFFNKGQLAIGGAIE